MSRVYESDIAEDLYDLMFKNDYKIMDFVSDFPHSFVDKDNATITMLDKQGREYQLRIFHTYEPARAK